MEVQVTEKVVMTNDELDILKKARQILSEIKENLMDATQLIDEQKFPDEVEYLLATSLDLENKRIFSIFNMYNDEERNKLSRKIINWEKLYIEKIKEKI